MKKICVMMAVYNPKEYIVEQVRSIFNQRDVEVTLVIRDDCSTNRLYINRILKEYKRIRYILGDTNLGVAMNIRKLVEYVIDEYKDYEYFAYSDQDDVWLPDKLITGINAIKDMDCTKPNLYYSNLTLVDEFLNNSRPLFKSGVVKNSFGQSLAQIFEFACTSVFNKSMLNVLISKPWEFMQFDHMLYYISIIQGQAYYDDTSYILYRQHGDNVSGSKNYGIKYFLKKSKILTSKENGQVFKNIARYLDKYYMYCLNDEQKEILGKVKNYNGMISRIALILEKRVRAGYQPKDLYCAIRLILNRY